MQSSRVTIYISLHTTNQTKRAASVPVSRAVGLATRTCKSALQRLCNQLAADSGADTLWEHNIRMSEDQEGGPTGLSWPSWFPGDLVPTTQALSLSIEHQYRLKSDEAVIKWPVGAPTQSLYHKHESRCQHRY